MRNQRTAALCARAPCCSVPVSASRFPEPIHCESAALQSRFVPREARGQGSAVSGALGGLVLHHAEHLLKFREADIPRAVHVKRGCQALDAVPQLSTLGSSARSGCGTQPRTERRHIDLLLLVEQGGEALRREQLEDLGLVERSGAARGRRLCGRCKAGRRGGGPAARCPLEQGPEAAHVSQRHTQ